MNSIAAKMETSGVLSSVLSVSSVVKCFFSHDGSD